MSNQLTCLVFYLATASSNQPDTAGQSGLAWSWLILYEDDDNKDGHDYVEDCDEGDSDGDGN